MGAEMIAPLGEWYAPALDLAPLQSGLRDALERVAEELDLASRPEFDPAANTSVISEILIGFGLNRTGANRTKRYNNNTGTLDQITEAAKILCQVSTDKPISSIDPDKEVIISTAFVHWYRRLLDYETEQAAQGITDKIEPLKKVLPTAANVLEEALAESNE